MVWPRHNYIYHVSHKILKDISIVSYVQGYKEKWQEIYYSVVEGMGV